MSHEFENIERASDRLPDCQFTQTGYTASYSYLVEAELDREWKRRFEMEKTVPGKD